MGLWFGGDASVFRNGSVFRKTAGAGHAVINVPLLNAFGTLEVLSGRIRFDIGQLLDGRFNVGTGAALQFNGGTSTYTPQTIFTGAGQYLLTSGTLQGLLDYIPNLFLLGGTVSLSPNYQTNGSIARLDLDGSTLVGSNLVTGTLNLNSGFIAGPMIVNTNGTINWASGRFAEGSALTIQTNGIVNLLTSGQKELGGGMTNRGKVFWSGGNFYLINDASAFLGGIENQPGGVFEVQGDLSLLQWTVNNYAYFRNNGLLRKPIGTGTATLDVPYFNQGNLEQLSGVLSFGRNFSLTDGTVSVGIGSTGHGRIGLAGTASLAGRLVVQLLNGFIPPTNGSYIVMNYGVVAGTFTNYDGLNVGFGRYFVPTYTPTSLILDVAVTNGVNQAPVLAAISDRTVNEGSLVTFTNSASDPDGNQIFYTLASGPAGATVNLTNGVFTWTPTETQGPSTNSISIRAYDNGNPSLEHTRSFNVIVREVNTAPVFTAAGNLTVRMGRTLTFTNAATDADLPTNSLTFSLEPGAPAGVTINPTNGILVWQPGLAFNNTTNLIPMRVTDNGSPTLSHTRSLTVIVNPATIPVLTPLGNAQNPFHFQFTSDVGTPYIIQLSTNLNSNWIDLFTTNATANVTQILATNTPGPIRLLRVKMAP